MRRSPRRIRPMRCPARSSAGRSSRHTASHRRPPPSATSRSGRPDSVAFLTIVVRLVVADRAVQRGRDRERRTGRGVGAGLVGLDAVNALLGEHARGAGEQVQRLQQVARDQRDAHVELELALHAADRDRGVVADHLRGDLQHDLGDHRVDLAGHDRGALLQLGQEQLADARARARAHQREVAGDLGQRHGDHLQRARELHQRVAVGLRLEGIQRRRDLLEARLLLQPRAHLLGELRVRVQARAGGGARRAGSARRARAPPRPAPGRAPSARRSRRTPARASRAPRPSGACAPPSRRSGSSWPSSRTSARAARAPAAARSGRRPAPPGARPRGTRRWRTGPC